MTRVSSAQNVFSDMFSIMRYYAMLCFAILSFYNHDRSGIVQGLRLRRSSSVEPDPALGDRATGRRTERPQVKYPQYSMFVFAFNEIAIERSVQNRRMIACMLLMDDEFLRGVAWTNEERDDCLRRSI